MLLVHSVCRFYSNSTVTMKNNYIWQLEMLNQTFLRHLKHLVPLGDKNITCMCENHLRRRVVSNKRIIWYYNHKKLHKGILMDKHFACLPKFKNHNLNSIHKLAVGSGVFDTCSRLWHCKLPRILCRVLANSTEE